MGPKVQAAREFAENTRNSAGIGELKDPGDILVGRSGTIITGEVGVSSCIEINADKH